MPARISIVSVLAGSRYVISDWTVNIVLPSSAMCNSNCTNLWQCPTWAWEPWQNCAGRAPELRSISAFDLRQRNCCTQAQAVLQDEDRHNKVESSKCPSLPGKLWKAYRLQLCLKSGKGSGSNTHGPPCSDMRILC